MANQHYNQVTEDHMQRAAQGGTGGGTKACEKGGTNGGTAKEDKLSQIVTKCIVASELDAETATPVHPSKYTRRGSNPQPSVPKTDALSN